MTDVSSERSALERYLLDSRNSDGGWGYYRGKASRLEPTSWALLALAGRSGSPEFGRALRDWPSSQGLLLESPGAGSNFGFHAVALLALHTLHIEHQAGNASLVASLQQARGIPLDSARFSRQDNSLQAWSWIGDTFSWVEPTAWSLLALKKWSRTKPSLVDTRRIAEGEAVLIDRACVLGGWNYGNSNMLGKELNPYVSVTAVGLLAMQDRMDHPAIERSRQVLERERLSERSGLALSLSLIALRVMGAACDDVMAALKRQVPTTLLVGNQLHLALSLYALSLEHRDVAVRI